MPAFAADDLLGVYLQTDLSESLPAANFALDSATALIQGYTGQYIFYVEDDAVDLYPKGATVLLPQIPVVDVTEVISDTEDVNWLLRPAGVLELRSGWIDLVTVTYSHGYETIPEAIVLACLQEAARIFGTTPQQSGVASETESIDDYSRTVRYIEGGSVGGVAMLDGTRDLLDPFRFLSLV